MDDALGLVLEIRLDGQHVAVGRDGHELVLHGRAHVLLNDEVLDPLGAPLVDGADLLAHVHQRRGALVPDLSFGVQAAPDAGHGLLGPVVGEQFGLEHLPTPVLEPGQGFAGLHGQVQDDLEREERVLVEYGQLAGEMGKDAAQVREGAHAESGFAHPGGRLVKQFVGQQDRFQ